MKKGFTIVELLAVVIVLAIILVIAIPSVISIVDNIRIEAFKKNEQQLISAARSYVVANRGVLPANIGDTIEISLNTLQSGNYITKITSPSDKNFECNAYVLVTKTNKSNYDYSPHLNCVNNIGNLTDDGLIVHYKLDDFQEPTENLIANGDMTDGINGWVDNQSMTKSIVERDGKNYLRVVSSQASSTPGVRYIDLAVTTNTLYTYSISLQSLKNNILLWVTNNSNTQIAIQSNLHANQGYDKRVSISFNSGSNSVVRLWVLFSGVEIGDWFEITEGQLERKNYATPFVNGIREGTVINYSDNNHRAILNLINTPRWIEESKFGTGAYSFGGGKNITVPDNGSLNLSTYTYSFWVRLNTDQDGTWRRFLGRSGGGSDRTPGFWFYSTNNRIHLQQRLINGTNGGGIDTSALTLGTWHHIIFSSEWNGTNTILRSWKDGAEPLQNSYASAPVTGNAPLVLVGPPNNNYEIDDIRIYNRVLSADEIKQLYNAGK